MTRSRCVTFVTCKVLGLSSLPSATLWKAAGASRAERVRRAPSGGPWERPGQVRTAPMEMDAAAHREHKKVLACPLG